MHAPFERKGEEMTMCKEMEELVAIAKAEGIAEGKRTIVINILKKEKYNTEEIAEILGLTLEEIEEIRKSM